jgi:MFS transporter, DHA1 family, multidrug resistance protein
MSSSSGVATAARASPLTPGAAALLLALLLGLQPITSDLYLPALPLLARDLAAPVSVVQLTMSAMILSFGIAQLAWGPVADRVGRRPVLLAGLALYAVAGLGAALATGIGQVVAWRAVQGACMSAAVVCGRAMVRDLYEPHEGAQVMTRALAGLGVFAIVSPLLGGLISSTLGWRATMGLIGLWGAVLAAHVLWRTPETIRALNPRATHLRPLAAQMGRTLRHPQFVAWAALVTCTYAGLFVYLASATFVYIDVLGLSPWQCGLAMASCSVAYICGTFVCRRWLPRHGMVGSVVRAAGFTLVAGLLMIGLAAAGTSAVWAVLLPQWVYCLGHGVHQPCGQTGAVAPFPHAAGVASALAGFLLAMVAFGVGLVLGRSMDGTVRPLAYGMGFWALMTTTVAWTLVRRLGPERR